MIGKKLHTLNLENLIVSEIKRVLGKAEKGRRMMA